MQSEAANSVDSKRSGSSRSDQQHSLEKLDDDEHDIGRIALEFVDGDSVTYSEYPSTYYTFSAKERLMLIFVENFRREFMAAHPARKPLVLAIPNECGLQKFVSTTIRPTSFLFYELIDSWDGPARFVADFVKYQPLEDQLQLVSVIKIKSNKYDSSFLFGKILLNSFSFNIYTFITWVVVCLFVSLHFFTCFSYLFLFFKCFFFSSFFLSLI